MPKYKQLILFGSPGTGKSHKVKEEILPELHIDPNSNNSIRTVFHPEYTYGDFMGKLLPLTKDGQVQYNYYEGFFLKAIAQAYKNILAAETIEEAENVALVIDEINRGNSAAIFGMGFQLLDRDEDGWSTYEINVSDMEFDRLLDLIGVHVGSERLSYGRPVSIYKYENTTYKDDELNSFLSKLKIKRREIRIPGNLSIIATMNTSDSSIYYMDSAFKRRWDWQYINIDSSVKIETGIAFADRAKWHEFVDKLNSFIKANFQYVRKAEDKQIGYWFIRRNEVFKSDIQNKVMFFLWDSVFTTSKAPLAKLLNLEEQQIVTFGDFSAQVDTFINKVSEL